MIWIMLNPSVGDGLRDDPTIVRCMEYTNAWGYTRMSIINLFGYISTDPKVLKTLEDPVGPENSVLGEGSRPFREGASHHMRVGGFRELPGPRRGFIELVGSRTQTATLRSEGQQVRFAVSPTPLTGQLDSATLLLHQERNRRMDSLKAANE